MILLTKKFPATKKFNEERAGEMETAVVRLRRRLTEVVAIDFFDSLGRQSAEGLVASLETRLNPDSLEEDNAMPASAEYRERVWVTRKEFTSTVWQAHG